MKSLRIQCVSLLCGWAVLAGPIATAAASIFPEPRKIQSSGEHFELEASIPVIVPDAASPDDLRLARLLLAEMGDKYGLALHVRHVASLPQSRFILMGALGNPLVQEWLKHPGHDAAMRSAEGYLLSVDAKSVVVAGADDSGALYGFESLRQLITDENGRAFIQGARVRDWPDKPFRGIKLYLPGHENIAYFHRFVRDFMALYKYNRLIVEMDGAMRFDRHPEVNAGWLALGRDMNATRRERSPGPGRQFQDSANADAADSEVLEKSEVGELVAYARQFHIEVIPEIPSLTHSYYLLTRHRELAEIPKAEWPDTYCPSNPKVYELLWDILDEYIEVMKPRMVHVGHDEWRMPWGICPLCRDKDPRELYARDLNKIHDYLARKGVTTAIWGDHLIEALRGERLQKVSNPAGESYETPGGLSAEQVKKLIPKDILVFNWFWNDGQPGEGEADDAMLSDWGFEQAYGNMEPDIQNYARRARRKGIVGGAPSSWAATNEFNFGKDLMYDFLGSEQLLWSGRTPPPAELSATIQNLLPSVRRNLSARPLSSDYDPVSPVDISGAFNSAAAAGVDLEGLTTGRLESGSMIFELRRREGKVAVTNGPGTPEPSAISIGEDVSSLIFLHASAKPARNRQAYEGTWNYADTSDLLGWYEVTYEDGLVATVPLRYGANVLEATWAMTHEPSHLAYEAQRVNCEIAGRAPLTFFAYEWLNPRVGVRVKEVRLHAPAGISGLGQSEPANNAVLLIALSVVKKRIPPEPKPMPPH